jgi:uncharacterized protein (DUF4415 family)
MTAFRKARDRRTDWARLRGLTDAQTEQSMREDDEWRDLVDFDWSKADVVEPRRKRAISIRLDEDLIEHFKASGPGYQGRINAVLRSYVDASARTKAG